MERPHFLVPLDFSTHADYALQYAIFLARQLQAQLTLLHVLYLPSLLITARLTPYLAAEEAEAKALLTAALQQVETAGLTGDYQVVYGVPWTQITTLAAARHCDLIIMGSHGRTGLPHAMLGSVAERVLRLAPCPVLITRGHATHAHP
jgi:nucleotide-binding universal stress UspA family protein